MPDAEKPSQGEPESRSVTTLEVHLGGFGLVAFVCSGFVAMALGEDYMLAGAISTLIGLGLFMNSLRNYRRGSGDVSDIGPSG